MQPKQRGPSDEHNHQASRACPKPHAVHYKSHKPTSNKTQEAVKHQLTTSATFTKNLNLSRLEFGTMNHRLGFSCSASVVVGLYTAAGVAIAAGNLTKREGGGF